MSIQNTWARHYQSPWEERAGDPTFPLWFRVAALAYGRHKANGHANFGRGNLSLIFGGFDDDGEFKPVSKHSVQSAIRAAKKYGLIAEDSNSECLVVPYHAVIGGLGNAEDECSVHLRKAQRRTSGAAKVVRI